MNRQVIVFQKLARRMPDIYGKYAGRLWEQCRTSMGNMPDVYGNNAGHLWEICRTFMGTMPDIYGKCAGHLWEILIVR
jgi:hypothetical protein